MSDGIRLEIESGTNNSYTEKQDYSVTDLYHINLFSVKTNEIIFQYGEEQRQEKEKLSNALFSGKEDSENSETEVVNQLFTTQKVAANFTMNESDNFNHSSYLISSALLIVIFVFVFLRFFSNRKKGGEINDNQFS